MAEVVARYSPPTATRMGDRWRWHSLDGLAGCGKRRRNRASADDDLWAILR
jgi:hypothetical protein